MLPLADGSGNAEFNALQLDDVSHEFPLWSNTEAWNEINDTYKKKRKKSKLIKTDQTTGGQEVDIMLGMRYKKYFPTLIYQLPCGLGIYKSRFKSIKGTRGILAGPHASWRQVIDTAGHSGFTYFLTQEARAYHAES